jgi:hypothetical protein
VSGETFRRKENKDKNDEQKILNQSHLKKNKQRRTQSLPRRHSYTNRTRSSTTQEAGLEMLHFIECKRVWLVVAQHIKAQTACT